MNNDFYQIQPGKGTQIAPILVYYSSAINNYSLYPLHVLAMSKRPITDLRSDSSDNESSDVDVDEEFSEDELEEAPVHKTKKFVILFV